MIYLILAGTIALLISVFGAGLDSGLRQGSLIAVLFSGLIVRALKAQSSPTQDLLGLGPLTVFLPMLWPTLVWNDLLGSWMRKVGFGRAFIIPVTTLFMVGYWLPFSTATPVTLVVLAVTSYVASVLRNVVRTRWYLAVHLGVWLLGQVVQLVGPW